MFWSIGIKMVHEEKFIVNKRQNASIECLDLSGYLDAHTAPHLENALQETINLGNNKIIVNFTDLDYISSAGLGVFMAFIEEVRNSGGDIKLSNMKEKVFSVFDLLGFPLLFDIEKDEQNAVLKFHNNDTKL